MKLRSLLRRGKRKPLPEAERLLRLYRETHEDVRRIKRRAA